MAQMETLISLSPATPDRPVPGPGRTDRADHRAWLHPVFTERSVRGWLRLVYGACMLASAPREALALSQAARGTALWRHLSGYAPMATLASQPFVSAKWSCAMRLRRIIEHCAIVDRLGPPFDISGSQFAEVIAFQLGDSRCRLTLDTPGWLACDGLLSASLWVEFDRMFSITFCLSDRDERTAYVGGIQGRRGSGVLDQNRALTKAAHGMRPKDLAFELFRMLLPRLGVARLKGVADGFRYQKTRRAMLAISADDQVQLDYDEMWESRGGSPGEDGFYLVPVQRQPRDPCDIPARKRSIYARRYDFLNRLNEAVDAALETNLAIKLHAGIKKKP